MKRKFSMFEQSPDPARSRFNFPESLMKKSIYSARLRRIRPSASVMAKEIISRLKKQNQPIFDLTIGEPSFEPPSHVLDAVKRAMFEGKTKYTPPKGTPELRSAIREKFLRDNRIEYQPDEIIVGSGAKQIIDAAFAATLNSGDDVIIPAPYWISYHDLVRLYGGRAVTIDSRLEQSFKLQPDDLRKSITKKTKWLILNTPNNPSGSVYGKAELEALGQIVSEHEQIWVMVDEIYEHFCYDGAEFISFASLFPQLRDRILTINGVSKTYGMTGFRIGFAGGPANLIAGIETLLTQSTSCASSLGQAAALAALNGPQDNVRTNVADLAEKRNLLSGLLQKIDEIGIFEPEGGFYFFIDVGPYLGKRGRGGAKITSEEALVAYLLSEYGVATIGGANYGCSPYLRLSFAGPKKEIQAGAEALGKALEELR